MSQTPEERYRDQFNHIIDALNHETDKYDKLFFSVVTGALVLSITFLMGLASTELTPKVVYA